MFWIVVLLIMLALVALVSIEIIDDVLTYRDLQRRLGEERRRREEDSAFA